ncbi:MAG: O-antigen ligase family protein [Acidobacteria bacterium]|nr:O-antigen ligase family protein [Acidobacteriota bacterium]
MRAAALAVTFLLPLIVWPDADGPFSSPKFLLLGVAAITGVAWAGLAGRLWQPLLPRDVGIALAAWLAVLGLSGVFGEFVLREALLLPAFGAGWFLALVSIQPRGQQVASALSLSGLLVGCVALLQFSGLDPYRVFGWMAAPGMGSPRMKVFATLGNPNFVAAFLAAALPVTFALASVYRRRRVWFLMAAAVQGLAVAATGSRAALLALLAVLVWVACAAARRWLNTAAGMLLVMCLALAWTSERTLQNTLAGRAYIWRVAGSHLAERPALGFGPGAFTLKFAEWEGQRWKEGGPPAAERRFSGPQDHAHNDFVETLVDHGFAGLAAWLALATSLVGFAWRRMRETGSELVLGSSAGMVAWLAVSLVDFPSRRPAETFAFWTLGAILFLAVPKVEMEVT